MLSRKIKILELKHSIYINKNVLESQRLNSTVIVQQCCFLDSDVGIPADPDYLKNRHGNAASRRIGHKKESYQRQIIPLKDGVLRILNF
jgi:hypothetical protein